MELAELGGHTILRLNRDKNVKLDYFLVNIDLKQFYVVLSYFLNDILPMFLNIRCFSVFFLFCNIRRFRLFKLLFLLINDCIL